MNFSSVFYNIMELRCICIVLFLIFFIFILSLFFIFIWILSFLLFVFVDVVLIRYIFRNKIYIVLNFICKGINVKCKLICNDIYIFVKEKKLLIYICNRKYVFGDLFLIIRFILLFWRCYCVLMCSFLFMNFKYYFYSIIY